MAIRVSQYPLTISPENANSNNLEIKTLINYQLSIINQKILTIKYIFSFTQKIKRRTIQIDQGVEIQPTQFFVLYFFVV